MSEERDDALLLARLGRDPGLCANCRHRRLQISARSVFLRCTAPPEARLPRYPSLPVLECRGFRRADAPA